MRRSPRTAAVAALLGTALSGVLVARPAGAQTVVGATPVSFLTPGLGTFGVQTTGFFELVAVGAQGGGGVNGFRIGGRGASVTGTFLLTAGESYTFLIGGRGSTGTRGGGGGGGGTFVVTGPSTAPTVLLVAGGGGGAARQEAGQAGRGVEPGGSTAGGAGGTGGRLDGGGGGGGGLLGSGSAGGNSSTLNRGNGGEGGRAFAVAGAFDGAGGAGGSSRVTADVGSAGGIGGGGGSGGYWGGGGGGGGYGGGAGGRVESQGLSGQGGTSLVAEAATDVVVTPGAALTGDVANGGNGQLTVTFLSPAVVVPEPGTWALLGTGLLGVAAVARRGRRA